MHDKNKHTLLNRYIKVTVSLLIISTCFIVLKFSHGSRIFKQYVCNPIPESVRNIRAHRPPEVSGHRYVMHFKIDETDLPLILSSKHFKKVEWVKYKNGSIDWGDTPPWEKQNKDEYVPGPLHYEGESLYLYAPYNGRPEPEWFKPNDWDSPKVYVFKERNISYQQQIQILIYNEKLAEAYLVDYQEGHW